jgi:hypothetical protein
MISIFMYTCRVGQNRIYTPYITVYLMISCQNTVYTPYIYGSGQPYIYVQQCMYMYYSKVGQNHIYTVYIRCMYTILANPNYMYCR